MPAAAHGRRQDAATPRSATGPEHALKQTLQLKLSQHLTLTPQLQQSIRLLQLSTIELNAEVERILQENPLLEKEENEGDDEAPLEVPLAGVTRSQGEGEGEIRSAAADDEGGDERPVDAPNASEVADFADYSSGDGDWGSGSTSSDDEEFFPQQVATSGNSSRC